MDVITLIRYNRTSEVNNMKCFDCHADIGMDVLMKCESGEKDILNQFHLKKLQDGEVSGVSMACFFEGHESMETAKKMIELLKEEIELNTDSIHFYRQGEFSNNRLNALISIEGMCFVKENPEAFLDWAYEQGVRIGSLCWNDENALATGAKGNPTRGLTELGKRAIKHMNKLKMIVDVSHTNEKSFYDILQVSTRPIMATHSNARKLCNADRNLTDQQIKAIATTGGLIGLVAAKYFVADTEENQNAATLAKHAAYIKELTSINHVCIGFDYMDFLAEPFGRQSMAYDLQDASMSQNLIEALKDEGFTHQEVEMIAYQNIERFLIENL